MDLIKEASQGNINAVSRLITLVENNSPKSESIIKEISSKVGKAKVIGVTGAPGSGKSTLVDLLAKHYAKQSKKIAVIAIDPSSPYSGGAVLGDRIRMNKAIEEGIYIRSMASRGSLGGLSEAVPQVVNILDAVGYDYIFIETVGVGQAEIDIVKIAHTCLVVLVPGMGDGVQAFKAGIREIADLFIINKADRKGVDILEKEILSLLSLEEKSKDKWEVKITKSVATEEKGIEDLIKKIEEHQAWLSKDDNLSKKYAKFKSF